MDLVQELPHLTLKYVKSREGKKCLRRCMMPIIIIGSLIMLLVGAIWAKYQYPTCGKDLDSSRFSIKRITPTTRRISGNSCPGYDWTEQKSTYTAGEHHYSIDVPISPRISKTPTYVTDGLIGYALNSIPLYATGLSSKADAVKVQSSKFDQCGGSDSNPVGFTFDLPITGLFRYFAMPGDGNPLSHAKVNNTQLNLCTESRQWYTETSKAHSPLVGFMADGIPIYGPQGKNGTAPADLDGCGGHKSDMPFYHYHYQAVFPYSVKCLMGCLDGGFNSALNSGNCDVDSAATALSNYQPIANMTFKYGGSGVNSTDWSGPACLLIFGFLIFIPGMLCCICMMCGGKIASFHDKKKELQEKGEFGYYDSDDLDSDEDWEYEDEYLARLKEKKELEDQQRLLSSNDGAVV